MARNPAGTGPNLNAEQIAEIDALKQEIKYYEDLKKKATNKRSKIKKILDNFNQVITGNVILQTTPSINDIEDVINRSIILSKSDVQDKINDSDGDQELFTSLKTALNNIFKLDATQDVINTSDDLGPNEMYSRILWSWVGLVETDTEVKEAFRNIIDEIETDLL